MDFDGLRYVEFVQARREDVGKFQKNYARATLFSFKNIFFDGFWLIH